ncbi:hypothetical protein HYPSUDRAFT_151171, partial [Hypholoma sublateritium FD-334 SS-4]
FINGLNAQWHNTASWIHHNCASILDVSETDLLKADVRKTKFHEEIGWVSESGVYSSVDVPILQKTWGGKYALSSVFLNPKLMGVHCAFSANETLQEVGSSTGIYYFSDYKEYLTIIETSL